MAHNYANNGCVSAHILCVDDNDKAAVFQRNCYKLAQGITNPATFGAKLYAARLITAEVRDYAAFSPSCKRVLRLLSAVEVQIKLFPVQNFPQFVKILCEEGCYYLLANLFVQN